MKDSADEVIDELLAKKSNFFNSICNNIDTIIFGFILRHSSFNRWNFYKRKFQLDIII